MAGGGIEVSSINRALQVLRRMLQLAVEWGKVEKAAPRISLLPGEKRRERVLSPTEEAAYLKATQQIGESILESYGARLKASGQPRGGNSRSGLTDPFLLRDVTTILIDRGSARRMLSASLGARQGRRCPHPLWEDGERAGVVPLPIARRHSRHAESVAASEWVFPAPTRSGHIEKSTLVKQHGKASDWRASRFPLYTFRHTCLTRWSALMDPYTLATWRGTAILPPPGGTFTRRRTRSWKLSNRARGVRKVGTNRGTLRKRSLQREKLRKAVSL